MSGGAAHRCVWQPLRDGQALRIEIETDPVEESASEREATDGAWSRIRAANPRAFNGPILAYTSADPGANLVRCRRDEYRRLAVTPPERCFQAQHRLRLGQALGLCKQGSHPGHT